MIKEVREVVWYTTPTELRELANRLEAAWKKAAWGQDVPSEFQYGNEVGIRVMIDQEKMHHSDWRSVALKSRRVKKNVNFNGKEVLVEGQIERELKDTEIALLNESEPCWLVDFQYDGITFRGAWRKSECKACQ